MPLGATILGCQGPRLSRAERDFFAKAQPWGFILFARNICDTPQVLQQYVKAFDERIMGLTAESPEAIAEVAERYKIRFEKVPLKNGDYTMNHTADTLLFDADGDFADFIPYLPMSMRQNEKIAAAENDRIIEKLKELVAS